MDREELRHERAAALQREGLQAARQPGPRRSCSPAALQQAPERAEDDASRARRATSRRTSTPSTRCSEPRCRLAILMLPCFLLPTGGRRHGRAPRGRLCRPRASTRGSCLRSSCSGCFFVVPLGLIVAYSFWETVDYNVVHDWTLDNYRYFFSVSTYRPDDVGDGVGLGARDRDHDLIAFPFTYWLVRYVPRKLQRPAARARHPAVLDELPAPRLLVAQHPRRRRCDQPLPAVDAHHGRARVVRSSTTGRRSCSCSSTSTSRLRR